jgi:hypothetical protein
MITEAIWNRCRDNLSVFGIDVMHLYPEYIGPFEKLARKGDTFNHFTVTVSRFGQFDRDQEDHIIGSLAKLQRACKVDRFLFKT